MLDFRQHSAVRAKQDRQQRRRLLLLILGFGVVVILAGRLSQPDVWRSLDLLFSPPQKDAGGTDIDNRLDVVRPEKSPPDAIVAPKERPTPTDGANVVSDLGASDFSVMHDDAPSTRDEQALTLRLLDILNRTDAKSLAAQSLGPISYAQLLRQPNQYRGKLVDVSGTVRRVCPIELFPNEYGFKRYYQVWLWPFDNPSSPIVIHCLELPHGFPVGMDVAEQADVTGFFCKRWAYQAKDTLRIAPSLLAKTLQWQKRPVMAPASAAPNRALPVLVCATALAALLIAWFIYFRTRPSHPELPDQPPNFDALNESQNPTHHS